MIYDDAGQLVWAPYTPNLRPGDPVLYAPDPDRPSAAARAIVVDGPRDAVWMTIELTEPFEPAAGPVMRPGTILDVLPTVLRWDQRWVEQRRFHQRPVLAA